MFSNWTGENPADFITINGTGLRVFSTDSTLLGAHEISLAFTNPYGRTAIFYLDLIFVNDGSGIDPIDDDDDDSTSISYPEFAQEIDDLTIVTNKITQMEFPAIYDASGSTPY
jgi:hypothetical protein